MKHMYSKQQIRFYSCLLFICSILSISCSNKEKNNESGNINDNTTEVTTAIDGTITDGLLAYSITSNTKPCMMIIGVLNKSRKTVKEISIPSYVIKDNKKFTITEIGDEAFRFCESLERIIISNKVECIGEYAFYHCKNLSDISIPNSVTTIKRHAFDNCNSLKQLSIPPCVKEIGAFAFADCSNLEKISLHSTIDNFGILSLSGCNSLKDIFIHGFDELYIDLEAYEELPPCTLHVSMGMKEKYLNSHYSEEYKDIIEDADSFIPAPTITH